MLSKVRAARASVGPGRAGERPDGGERGATLVMGLAMAYIVETAQKGTFRLRSELTGGYVNVGACSSGMFVRLGTYRRRSDVF